MEFKLQFCLCRDRVDRVTKAIADGRANVDDRDWSQDELDRVEKKQERAIQTFSDRMRRARTGKNKRLSFEEEYEK